MSERIAPGTAVIRDENGLRYVEHADPVIRVSTDLLASLDLDGDAVEPDGALRLDSAGEYRYRFVCAESEHEHIYERIQP